MSYEFEPGRMYRMPTHFGPSLGPRQGLEARKYSNKTGPEQIAVAATFEAEGRQLDALLPPGFEALSPARIVFSFTYFRKIEWLAGRGYNTLGVRFPARFRGKTDDVSGEFLAVLWENRTEPIITGREELGVSKIFCELPDPDFATDPLRCEASWEGTTFAILTLTGRCLGVPPAILPNFRNDGLLHYKYVPRTQMWDAADAQYAVLTPPEVPNLQVTGQEQAEGQLRIIPAAWECLPTLYNEVTALSRLSIGKCISAGIMRSVGYKDLSDQRVLS